MQYSAPLKILLVVLAPLLIFLLVSDFIIFNDSFYKEKFLEYGVLQSVPNAAYLHQKVMDFIQGKSSEVPNQFNAREYLHLWDVRNVISASRTIMNALLIFFALAFLVFAFMLKDNKNMVKFAGQILFFGGLLTIIIAASFLFLIRLDFLSSFESFHRIFVRSGTYAFDPATELIVNLYPEELFMDIGIKISEWVVVSAIVINLLGISLLLKSKSKKNKKIWKNFISKMKFF